MPRFAAAVTRTSVKIIMQPNFRQATALLDCETVATAMARSFRYRILSPQPPGACGSGRPPQRLDLSLCFGPATAGPFLYAFSGGSHPAARDCDFDAHCGDAFVAYADPVMTPRQMQSVQPGEGRPDHRAGLVALRRPATSRRARRPPITALHIFHRNGPATGLAARPVADLDPASNHIGVGQSVAAVLAAPERRPASAFVSEAQIQTPP